MVATACFSTGWRIPHVDELLRQLLGRRGVRLHRGHVRADAGLVVAEFRASRGGGVHAHRDGVELRERGEAACGGPGGARTTTFGQRESADGNDCRGRHRGGRHGAGDGGESRRVSVQRAVLHDHGARADVGLVVAEFRASRGRGFTLTVTGSNFVSGASVRWNGSARTTTFVSASQLTATIAAADIAAAGTAQVTVANPDGSVSNALSFTITAPGPTLASLSPSSAPARGGFTLTVRDRTS